MGNVLTLENGEQALVPASSVFDGSDETSTGQVLAMTGNIVLNDTSERWHYLDPNGVNRTVTIPDATTVEEKQFSIQNISGGPNYIDVTDGTDTVRVRGRIRIYLRSDGSVWRGYTI